jgi:putative hydrolase of the HAD superfamily
LIKSYQHILFDLDHTLWDFNKNSHEALSEVFNKAELKFLHDKLEGDFDVFYKIYHQYNDVYWEKYRNGEVNKEEVRNLRFYDSLKCFDVNNMDLAIFMADEYLKISPYKTHLVPGTIDLLDYLNNKYQLHIITNGFNEVQFIKLAHSNLKNYFDVVVTSEEAGANKPDATIFNYTLNKIKTLHHQCIMIGDSFTSDIIGARNVGIDQIYFRDKRHFKEVSSGEDATFKVDELAKIKRIL